MTKSCRACNQAFEVTDSDLEFYDKVSPMFGGKKELIPPPTLCAECRTKRRLAFRNERRLYNDTCDHCGRNIVSLYSPDKSCRVFCHACWYSDAYDPLRFGRAYDFSRTFAAQLTDLLSVVPMNALISVNSINSEYSHYCIASKDCYLSCRIGESESVLYSYMVISSKSCADCYNVFHCESCYECIDCERCYSSSNLQQCKAISDSAYCFDCVGCESCLGCAGLRNKRYHVFNRPVTQEEFLLARDKLHRNAQWRAQFYQQYYHEVYLQHPVRPLYVLNTENASGDCITNSKNIDHSFDVDSSEDISHSWGVAYSRDVYDGGFVWGAERAYETISNTRSRDMLFCQGAWEHNSSLLYCMMCVNRSQHAFGSVGLKGNQYCILNQQYSKEEYEALVPKIIAKMREDGEWGEFFDRQLSPFGYNETVAQEYFPLEKDQALRLGFVWSDYVAPIPRVEKIVKASQLPDSIFEIPDSVLDWAIECEVSGKPFKVIKQELRFLREHGYPLPRRHPDVRHMDRMKLRNPRKLFERSCGKCGKPIQTTYAPERPERVYCEECYLKEVY